ncbi:MAG TPA: hypothetical protein VH333_03820 [Pseudonocardiaceae bacterium]|jgi:hypothetical protein|nr:hypothetical protein [Pseudonocardiaceae bacterium]
MAAPVRTPVAPVRPCLAVASGRGGDVVGSARRTAALGLFAAVVLGAGGVALATTAVVTDVWAVGVVLVSAVFAGVLLAATAWRKAFC